MNLRRVGPARRWTVGIVVAAVAGVIVPSTAPAAAQTDGGVPSDGGLEIVHQDISTGPAGTFAIRLRLPGIITPEDELTVSIHEPVQNETGFLDATSHRLGGVLVSRSSPLGALEIDFRLGEVDIVFDLNDGSLGAIEPGQVRLVRPGVYPLSISLRTANQDQIGSVVTFLIRSPDPPLEGEEPSRVYVISMLDVEPEPGSGAVGPRSSRAALESAPDLAGTIGTISISPHIIDDLWGTALLTDFVASASQWEFTSEPYVPIDEAALRTAGLTDEIASLHQEGLDALRRVREPAPPSMWFGRNFDQDTAESIWIRGIRDVIVPREVLSIEGEELSADGASAPVRGVIDIVTPSGTFRGLATNPEVLDHRRQRDQILAAHQTLAHLAVIALQPDDNTVVLDLGLIDDPQYAATLLSGIQRLDLVESVPAGVGLQRPRARNPIGARLEAEIALDEPRDRLDYSGYREARNQLTSFRSMIGDDDSGEVDALTEELHESLSIAIRDEARTTVWARAASFVRRELSLLDPPPLDSIRLTSRSARVPFSFQNRADYPLRVEVRILSDKLTVDDFDDGESTTIVLEPGVTTREFTLSAQTSGSFPITIDVYSPDGVLQIGSTRTSVRATAPTGVGLALTISAAAFLVAWWVLDVTRKRRAAR